MPAGSLAGLNGTASLSPFHALHTATAARALLPVLALGSFATSDQNCNPAVKLLAISRLADVANLTSPPLRWPVPTWVTTRLTIL